MEVDRCGSSVSDGRTQHFALFLGLTQTAVKYRLQMSLPPSVHFCVVDDYVTHVIPKSVSITVLRNTST